MMASPIQTVEQRSKTDISERDGIVGATERVGRLAVLIHTVDINVTSGGAVIGDELSSHQAAHARDE